MLLTFVVCAVTFAVLGLAIMSLVRSSQSVVGVTLGTLLPLSFVSDVFVLGATFPEPLEVASWVFPLRHATRAMTEAAHQGALWGAPSWEHLAVVLAWGAVGVLVVARRFGWTPREAERRVTA